MSNFKVDSLNSQIKPIFGTKPSLTWMEPTSGHVDPAAEWMASWKSITTELGLDSKLKFW